MDYCDDVMKIYYTTWK